MLLKIVTPEKVVFEGETPHVIVPGAKGQFEILDRHAPIVSILSPGIIRYSHKNEEVELSIKGGFVELDNNVVSVCVET